MNYRTCGLLTCCIVLLFFFTATRMSAQALSAADRTQLEAVEDSLIALSDSMHHAFIPDMRHGYCERFARQLVRALKVPNSYQYPFSRLQETINIIAPEDNRFRIFNWVIETSEVNVRYFGAIQMKAEELTLFPLVDYSGQFGKAAEDTVLTGGKWFGALYYRIMVREWNGEKFYTLFGKNSTSLISDKKVLDPLFFTEEGILFGAPVFNVSSTQFPNRRINRFIMEYKKDVSASLNWDADLNAICFDRLVSQVNDENRKYTFVPSGEYDGFRWIKGQWDYVQDLIPIQTFKDGDAPAPRPIKSKE